MYVVSTKERNPQKHEVKRQDNLPWVNSVKHLGTTITDALNNMGQDLLAKRAQYVAKNNELMQ